MTNIEDAGVTFYLDDSELGKGAPDSKGKKYIGKAVLSATVRDVDLWDQLMEQVNGLLLYKGSDLKTELINVLQNKTSQLEQTMESQESELVEQIQRAEQKASLADASRVRAEQQLRLTSTRVQDLTAQVEKWETWHAENQHLFKT